MARRVEVGPRHEKRHVGLGLGRNRGQDDWALHANDHPLAEPGCEQPVEPIHRALVRRAFGGYLDDLALEQLDTVVLREDPGLDHPVIVLHGEPSALELDRPVHRSASTRFF